MTIISTQYWLNEAQEINEQDLVFSWASWKKLKQELLSGRILSEVTCLHGSQNMYLLGIIL